jgi:hypothetical protein
MALSEKLFQLMPGGTEGNQENPHSNSPTKTFK